MDSPACDSLWTNMFYYVLKKKKNINCGEKPQALKRERLPGNKKEPSAERFNM